MTPRIAIVSSGLGHVQRGIIGALGLTPAEDGIVLPHENTMAGPVADPAAAFLAQGGRFGVGSDSNILLDAAEELRTLEYSQRLAHRARNVLVPTHDRSTGRSLYEGALRGGAQALFPGAGREAVGLKAGASLDVVSLAPDHPALIERREDEILDSWIFAGGRGVVDCVWRGGVKVVSNGCHARRDAIVARYRRALKTLLA